MDHFDEKHLSFVLRHYRQGAFDTQAAWEKLSGTRKRRSFRLLWTLPVAAALALGVFFSWRNAWTEYRSYDVAQAFTLVDGTRATLAPGAVLRYQPHKASRQVSMTGQVLYEVVHDEAHPFTVSASPATVTVLGTVFQVIAEGPDTRVNVTEGRVRFSGPRGDGLILTAGQSASLRDAVPVLEEAPLPNPSAWATGEFRYEAAPLETVLRELSAFYGITLTADAPGKRLTGTFSTDDLDETLTLIESALSVTIGRE
ncbi:MAG: FecR domain-containing protein [Bacteroidales bacterium]|nr:FecR domain-containing protein [Bacteroidales bacterium]